MKLPFLVLRSFQRIRARSVPNLVASISDHLANEAFFVMFGKREVKGHKEAKLRALPAKDFPRMPERKI